MKRKLTKLLIMMILIQSTVSCATLKKKEKAEETPAVENLKKGQPASFNCFCVEPQTFSILLKEAGRPD